MTDENPDFIKRGKSDCWPWQHAPALAPNKDAKMACDNPKCCNPRHVVKVASVEKTEDEMKAEIKADLDARGIKYHGNSSLETLKKLHAGE